MSDMQRVGFGFGRIKSTSERAGFALASALVSACLVTSKVDYGEQFIPSVVERAEDSDEEFVYVRAEPDPECEREGTGDLRLAIRVRDLNLEEDLEVRVVINQTYFESYPAPANNKEQRDDVSFCIPNHKFPKPCNLLEALVSSSFRGSTNRPRETKEGDLSSVHWWVIGDSADNASASFFDCADNLPDAGRP